MTLSTWLRSVRLHWLSPPGHWAEVMVRIDELESGHAACEPGPSDPALPPEADPEVQRDVELELSRRAHHEHHP